MKSKAQITSDITAKILSGGRRTTAFNTRTVFDDINDSMANFVDGGMLFDSLVGYSSNLNVTDDNAFVTKRWVLDNNVVPSFADVLLVGNTTGGVAINVDYITADTVAIYGPGKDLTNSAITTTELGRLSGITGNIETRLTGLETGLSWKEIVKVITDAPVTLSGTYTVQGYALQLNDRILVAAQSSGATNGIYTVKSGPWSRTADFDSGTTDGVKGAVIPCETGTYADKAYVCTNTGVVIIGTTPLTFDLFGGTVYTGTSGEISVSGSVISFDGSIATSKTDAKIKGAVAATAGLIPFGTGTADTVTVNSGFKFDGTALLNNVANAGIYCQGTAGGQTMEVGIKSAGVFVAGVNFNSATGAVYAGGFGAGEVQFFSANQQIFKGNAGSVEVNSLYGTGTRLVTVTAGGILQAATPNYTALFDHYADAGNITTAETDLYSDTIAVSQLATDGDKLEAEYGGTFVSSGTASRRVRLYFGGTVIFDSGALSISTSASWTLYCLIIRKSSTVVRYAIALQTQGAALSSYCSTGELTGLTLSAPNILKITGEAGGVGAATNDIVAMCGTVGYKKAA